MDFENDVYHLNDERKMPAKASSCKSAKKPCKTSKHSKSAKKASSKKESTRKASKTAHYDKTMVHSRNDNTDDETVAMLEEEKNCPSSRFNANNEREGFGSFYYRPCLGRDWTQGSYPHG